MLIIYCNQTSDWLVVQQHSFLLTNEIHIIPEGYFNRLIIHAYKKITTK